MIAAISVRSARRLALAKAGLLKPEWTGLPRSGKGLGERARSAAYAIVGRFGYLQLDTVSIAGARSHAIVLLSRLGGFQAQLAEELLQPGRPLFEYWGHEASWIPLDLYPAFEFRRREFAHHPWWGDVVGEHPRVAERLLARVRDEGPLRSLDMEGRGGRGWWDLKVAKRVASALWSSGELAVRERRGFQRVYDLAERVIPARLSAAPLPRRDGITTLVLKALDGHGWASRGTIAATWRLKNSRPELRSVFAELVERGKVIPCALESAGGRSTAGWIQPQDIELADRLRRVRPRPDRGVLLSPFDPVLWDRARVRKLFAFDQVLEIFKPKADRVYGYYCLPVLAGDRLVGRVDLKAQRKLGVLRVLSKRLEKRGDCEAGRALDDALERFAAGVGLELES